MRLPSALTVSALGALLFAFLFFSAASLTHADTVLWNTSFNDQLQARAQDFTFPDGTPSALLHHDGVLAIENTQVQIQYHVRVRNTATGEILASGVQIPEGTEISLEFIPHEYTDIMWFTAGTWYGSPYGDWKEQAAAPPIACLPKDKVFDRGAACNAGPCGFVALAVAPPSKTLSSTAGMACRSEGSDAICTPPPGTYTPVFDFAPTVGKFYARTTDAFDGFQCIGNDKPMTTGGSDMSPEAPFSLAVPKQSVPFTLTVIAGPENPETHAPSRPSLTSGGSCVVGQPHTINFISTDPDNDQVRYGVDWDADGSIDQYVPSLGYVPSGTAQNASRTYAVTGAKTVKVLAQDENGLTSNWATVSFDCAGSTTAGLNEADATDDGGGLTLLTPVPNLDLRVIPSLVRSGNTTKVNWSATGVSSCTVAGQNGDAWSGLLSAIGGNISKPITAETTYTLTCIDRSGGTLTKQATVRIIPTFQEK